MVLSCLLVVTSAKTLDYNNYEDPITGHSYKKSHGFEMGNIVNYIPLGVSSLKKASSALDRMMEGLPLLIKDMDPALKLDMIKVNEMVLDVCYKIV